MGISYEIVTQQHGGTITVDSKVGDFTEFTVRLRDADMGWREVTDQHQHGDDVSVADLPMPMPLLDPSRHFVAAQ